MVAARSGQEMKAHCKRQGALQGNERSSLFPAEWSQLACESAECLRSKCRCPPQQRRKNQTRRRLLSTTLRLLMCHIEVSTKEDTMGALPFGQVAPQVLVPLLGRSSSFSVECALGTRTATQQHSPCSPDVTDFAQSLAHRRQPRGDHSSDSDKP